ncbi:hypothetical protein [Halovivax gelatinilyticus]|uniref:hypothetical protein n=1 Tax=Halovivax gelatinilyticus TaxID=2961597 RepID=UPI0020CA5D69|nr:hypothetical protein [Halovivax gelatinilyticus]
MRRERRGRLSSRTRFRLAFGIFLGSALAGLVLTGATAAGVAFESALGGGAVALVIGTVAGIAIESRIDRLATAIGRTRSRRAAVFAPFGAILAFVPISLVSTLPVVTTSVALWSTLGVGVAGWIVTTMAQTRHIDRVIDDEPVRSVRIRPRRRPYFDLAFLALTLGLFGMNAYDGRWTMAGVWAAVGVSWIVSRVLEGRIELEGVGDQLTLDIHDAGLVRRYPFSRSFVPWDEINHVRHQDGELVFDRHLVDTRFDRDELDDVHSVVESIERVAGVSVLRQSHR